MSAIQFGFCLPIFAAPGERQFRTPNYAELDTGVTMQLGVTADELGYDSLWVADHLMLGRESAILEGWTTLAALAGATTHARLGMIHMAHFFRHPSMTAKMAATLDQISGGRLIHFVDGGNRPAEYAAYGLPWREPLAERVRHLAEEIELTLALWTSDQPVTYCGQYYQLMEALCRPQPHQRPHPPIWIGGAQDPMLQICARYAQGWNSTPVDLPTLRSHLAALATACTIMDRPFESIEKSLEMQILIAPDLDGIRQRLAAMTALDPNAGAPDPALDAFLAGATDEPPPSLAATSLIGTPASIISQLEAYVDAGISHFLFWFMDVPDDAGLRLFAERVFPHFRSSFNGESHASRI